MELIIYIAVVVLLMLIWLLCIVYALYAIFGKLFFRNLQKKIILDSVLAKEEIEVLKNFSKGINQEKRYEISKEICPNCDGDVELSREATDTEYAPFDYSPYGVCPKCGYGVIKTPQGLIPLDLKRAVYVRRDNEV